MKRIFAFVIALSMLLGNTVSVNAAGLRNIFDAEYYANQYKDLHDAFGYDEDDLWNHFLTYGLKEGRNMNPIIDVVKYRSTYADLDKAFGDNWDEYVNHYVTYGAREYRDTGTDFDLATYIEAYDDLKNAFEDDWFAAAKHYLDLGQKENRILINEESYEQFVNPEPVNIGPFDQEQQENEERTPIVQLHGNVMYDTYKKVENAFESTVNLLRQDGLTDANQVCVKMDENSISVDVNTADNDIDIQLNKDVQNNVYSLKMDYDFTWLEGYASTVNGKDSALYNKELLLALLSVISCEAEALFERIDMDYYSSVGISDSNWDKVGDYYIMASSELANNCISYLLTQDAYGHDSSYVLKTTSAEGTDLECTIAYDSSVVTYEVGSGNKDVFYGTVRNPLGRNYPCCSYLQMGSGCKSYDEYKEDLQGRLIRGARITEKDSITINGYTYHHLEVFFTGTSAKGDPDWIYVQVGSNEYIEIYDVWLNTSLEEFVKTAFYVTD